MTTNPGSRPLGEGRDSSRWRPTERRERLRLAQDAVAARFGVAPRAILGAVVVCVVVVLILGARLVLARTAMTSVPVVPQDVAPSARAGGARSAPAGAAAVGGGARPGAVPTAQERSSAGVADPSPGVGLARVSAAGVPDDSGSATPGPVPGQLVVHVVGRVRHPGVVRLPMGARVEQALTAAGGPRRDADLARLNLARPLVDGEQVVVLRPGEPDPSGAGIGGDPTGPSGGSRGESTLGSGFAGPGGSASVQPVNINTATVTELDALPGVGPVLAERILEWRRENGRFTSVEELGEVNGIGDAVLGRLRPLVRL